MLKYLRKCKYLGVFISKSLHHMKRNNTQKQLSIAEFTILFEAKLDEKKTGGLYKFKFSYID